MVRLEGLDYSLINARTPPVSVEPRHRKIYFSRLNANNNYADKVEIVVDISVDILVVVGGGGSRKRLW